jgi:hypothetical protein
MARNTRGRAWTTSVLEQKTLEAFKNDVEILTKANPEWLAPQSPTLESLYNVVLRLLQSCRHGRHQLRDH